MKATFFTGIATLTAAALASPAAVVETRDESVTAAQYNNFRLFAQYAAASFCNNENAVGQKVSCGGNFCPLVEASNVTTHAPLLASAIDARGIIALDHTNKIIVVSYRGSVSARNWITDLVFPQVPCDLTPGCLVHTGFLASWVALKAQTLAGLKTATAAYPKYTIAVTGHSLGAAIATIATGYIRKAGYKADVYTYGSPRVGNSYFVKFVTEQAGAEFRITHEADPIPRLPPILFNFRHTSPEYWMKEPTASAADFTVCSGYASIACNAGQTGFDMNLHGDYFEPVNGCEALPSTPWRRDLTDAQLAKQLAEWSKEDVSFAVGLVDRLV